MRLLTICLILFFVAFASAGERHGHEHHGEHHGMNHGHHGAQGGHHMGSQHHTCRYTSTQGFDYDLRMLETALRERDWKIYDSETKTTFHLNPCGSVHAPGCPMGSAVCEVDEKQQGVSFGSAEAPVWADGANGNTFEITFGNGELCNNGAPRKAVVAFSCALPSQSGPFRTHVTQIDEEKCTVNILVESPHACPVQVFCNSIHEPEVCGRTQDLCFWRDSQCISVQRSWIHSWAARHRVSPAVFLVFVGLGSFLMSCSLALCFCACCRAMRKRRCNAKTVLPTKKCKRSKKTAKKVETEQVAVVAADAEAYPMEEFPAQGVYVYQPLQTQLPDVYAQPLPQGYGFHMVQVVPGQHLQVAPQ